MTQSADPARVEIIYDGQCPACAAYFHLQKLEQSGLRVTLRDARQSPNLIRTYAARGIDLDREFVLKLGEVEYRGADAAFVLASLGTHHNWFRRLNWLLFRSPAVARWLYPSLRFGRRVLLLLLGRSPIHTRPPDAKG